MTVTQHTVVKPEKLVAAAMGVLDYELVLPQLFHKQGIDQYRGADDDTVSVKVPGTLPHRFYGWRNDRAQPIQFDTYKERKVATSFGGNAYNAVQMTDEQADMDMARWTSLLTPQTEAVARGLNQAAADTLRAGEYEVVLGDAQADLNGIIIEARRALNALHAPSANRVMVVGTDWESLLLSDDRLNLAQNVGDAEAASQLTEATLGKRSGFRFVVDQTLPGDEAYAFADSGFIFLNAAPSIPASKRGAGATISFDGLTLRWLQDYSTDYMVDRSVVNTYYGFKQVKDPLVYWDSAANEGRGQALVTASEYNCRSIKLLLDGASVYPAANSELGKATKLTGPGKQLTGAAATVVND